MDTKISDAWREFFKGMFNPVFSAVVDYSIANIDKMNFGKRDFLIKRL